MFLETWELLSYVVTVVGLPMAIFVFLFQQRKERENEEDQVRCVGRLDGVADSECWDEQ